VAAVAVEVAVASHPARVRGLKHLMGTAVWVAENVAPRTGAWIETRMSNA